MRLLQTNTDRHRQRAVLDCAGVALVDVHEIAAAGLAIGVVLSMHTRASLERLGSSTR